MSVSRLIVILFFSAVFLAFLTPMELGDVWWHLKTGQWIAENRALPLSDPFSLAPASGSGMFTLRGNWLSEALFHLAYLAGGIHGLIIFKAFIFLSAILLLHRTAAAYGLGTGARLVLLAPVVFVSAYYDELRPQSLSMLMFALTLYVLEKKPSKGGASILFSLPFIMAAWANMHGGYVSGASVVFAYALRELYFYYKGLRAGGDTAPLLLRFGLMASALAATGLNPNGYGSFARTSGMVGGSGSGRAVIHEHLPLMEFVSMTGDQGLMAGVIIIAGLCILSYSTRILWLRYGKSSSHPDAVHAVFFAGLLYASFTTYRAGVYFAFFSFLVIAENLSSDAEAVWDKVHPIVKRLLPAVLAVCLIIASALVLYPRSILKRPALSDDLMPVKTADFIKLSRPAGNLFHPYEWGGYLIWRLHPDYRVFIDGRAIGLMDEYSQVVSARAGWEETLDRFGVRTVAFWPLFPYGKNAPPVVLALLGDEDWEPVYWDLHSVVFMKSPSEMRPIKKDAVWELLVSLIGRNIQTNPEDPANYAALGEVYAARGFVNSARREFQKALALDPTNQTAAFWLRAFGN